MRPVRLQLKGFTSFKDGVDVSFENLDRFAICGPTGAGKSSMLDALTFALFADAPRKGTGNLANLISLGRKSFSIVFDFAAGERTFRVTRVRRRAGAGIDQLEVVVGSEKTEQLANGERAVTEKIERILGLNYGHFTQAVFLPQGKFSEFLKAKPADRRRLLNELLRLLVYERMQERAGKERETLASKKAQTDRRLREDYVGVTEEARKNLEGQQEEQVRLISEADAKLPTLREAWESTKRDRAWTVEWEGKQAERTRHQNEGIQISAARTELDAAGRAARVIPHLEQANIAHQENLLRQDALEKAVHARNVCLAEHEAAAATLASATEAARSLPALRCKLTRLAEAVGRLALRDQLNRQLHDHQKQEVKLITRRGTFVTAAGELTSDITEVTLNLTREKESLDASGFDEVRCRRLEAVLADAVRLQTERQRLTDYRLQFEQLDVNATGAETAASSAKQTVDDAATALDLARRRLENAEGELRTAESLQASAHLRANLELGQPCPVCHQNVTHLPVAEAMPELDRLRRARNAARTMFNGTENAASLAAQESAAAFATAQSLRDQANGCKMELAHRVETVHVLEQGLIGGFGDLLKCDALTPMEEQILLAVREAGVQRTRHQLAAKKVTELQTCLDLKQKDAESIASELSRIDEDLAALTNKFASDNESLTTILNEIREVAGTDEPGTETTRVQTELECIERALSEATQAERTTSDRLRVAEAHANTCTNEATSALNRAAELRTHCDEALRAAGFNEIASVRASYRTPEQVRDIHHCIAEYEATSRALDHRIAELDNALQGRRVTAETCQKAEGAFELCARQRKAAETQSALLAQQLQSMAERLNRAKELREELHEQERLHRIYDWLARDLRNDRFQAYLLEETLTGLVRDGSCHLARLTGDRYGLSFEDDRIYVVDHDNAGDRRGVDSLSGGETFLASLALALALSSQVQHIAGAVHLDCLFIDEGFGTLDPETLRTVSDAIRALQVGGRMVGVITHIPELKDEFDQRLVVTKAGATSQVTMEVA